MWKFENYSVTQILREIKVGVSRVSKSAILRIAEALKYEFYEFLHFLKTEIYQVDKVQGPEMAKMVFLELLESENLLSRKI